MGGVNGLTLLPPTHPPLTAFPPYFQSKSLILVRPTQPLWLKAFSRRIFLQQGPSCSFALSAGVVKPRKGWSAMHVRWLVASDSRTPTTCAEVAQSTPAPATLWPESLPVRSAPAAGSTRFCGPRHRNARARATKLETAMQAVGESDPAYPGLLEALKNPRERPGDGCAGPHRTEFFLEKAVSSRQELEKASETGKLSFEEDFVFQAEGRLLTL